MANEVHQWRDMSLKECFDALFPAHSAKSLGTYANSDSQEGGAGGTDPQGRLL
jgi:hypothetical protein